jgi:hypothetical protein
LLLLTEAGVEVALSGYRQGSQLSRQLILSPEDCFRYQQFDGEMQLVEVNPVAQTIKMSLTELNIVWRMTKHC